MATTNLIVDFLVIGIVSLIWLSPIAILIFDIKWLNNLLNMGAGGLPFILGIVYILGISVSRFADDVTSRWDDKWKDKIFGKGTKPSYHSKLNFVIAQSQSASDYLSYRRSIIRVSRACAVSFMIGCILWIVVAVMKASTIPTAVSISIAVFSLLLSVWLFRAWATVIQGYFHGIKDLYGHLSEAKKDTKNL